MLCRICVRRASNVYRLPEVSRLWALPSHTLVDERGCDERGCDERGRGERVCSEQALGFAEPYLDK